MEFIDYRVDEDGLAVITLNRPEKLNALNDTVLNGLSELFAQIKSDKQVKGVVITGRGKAFCAGADIKRLAECNAQKGYQFAEHGQSVFRALETIGKPSIAAINGYAFGGGCELAISTSIRIASHDAQFGQPEVKLGVIPGYGGTQRLARLIGKGRAIDLCLSGHFINAEKALSWGLISEIAEPDELLQRAKERLRAITKLAPLAIQSILEVVDRGFDMSLDDALHLEAVHFAKTCATADKQEGVSAFLEKRDAEFKGD